MVQTGDVLSIGQSKFYIRASDTVPPEAQTVEGTRRPVSLTPSFVTPQHLSQIISTLWETTVVPSLSVLKGMGLQQKWFQVCSRRATSLDEQLNSLWMFLEQYIGAQAMVVVC